MIQARLIQPIFKERKKITECTVTIFSERFVVISSRQRSTQTVLHISLSFLPSSINSLVGAGNDRSVTMVRNANNAYKYRVLWPQTSIEPSIYSNTHTIRVYISWGYMNENTGSYFLISTWKIF